MDISKGGSSIGDSNNEYSSNSDFFNVELDL